MRTILGVDEAGRGPLAGPVAVGVIAYTEGLDLPALFPGLNDSKKLTEKKRETLFKILQEQIRAGVIAATVCLSSAQMIDGKGIAHSVRHALTRGVTKLAPNPREVHIYLDGSLHAPSQYSQETIIGGDATVPAIMLASIAAKVTRDQLMLIHAKTYPQYGFEKHKGYGTKAHYEALTKHGLCEIHRSSFIHLGGKEEKG